MSQKMRTYQVVRHEDVSGVSGTGVVADAVEFPNGKAAVSFRPGPLGVASVTVYDSIADAQKVHGHGGRTEFVEHPDESNEEKYRRHIVQGILQRVYQKVGELGGCEVKTREEALNVIQRLGERIRALEMLYAGAFRMRERVGHFVDIRTTEMHRSLSAEDAQYLMGVFEGYDNALQAVQGTEDVRQWVPSHDRDAPYECAGCTALCPVHKVAVCPHHGQAARKRDISKMQRAELTQETRFEK